jgi:chromosome segregation ATPase
MGGSNAPGNEILASQVATLQAQMAALTTRVEDAEGAIGALDTRLTVAEGAIEALDGRLDTAESDILALEATTADHETRLDTAEATLVSHGTRLTTAEGNITTNTTNITALQAKHTALAAIAALTDSSGGTADNTVASPPNPADTPATADALRDDIVTNVLPVIRNDLADLTAKLNAVRAALV